MGSIDTNGGIKMAAATSAALIVGFSIQGLAIARSLTRHGVKVYAVVPNQATSILRHPSRYTSHARFIPAGSLRGSDVPRALNQIIRKLPDSAVILFPTTDDSVIALAEHWHDLDKRYVLSWSSRRERVLEIIHKQNLPRICRAAEVSIPKTFSISGQRELDDCINRLQLPILIKPDSQSFSFKTHLCNDYEEAYHFARTHSDDWPLVAQEWINGPSTSLYSYTCLIRKGKQYGGIVTRKLRSSPPSRGIGTMFETTDDAEVCDAGRRVAAALDVEGPVAVEFKKDKEGKLWLIEANVGRTEFCVDLLIGAGFDLPYHEFRMAAAQSPPPQQDLTPSVWYDTDKEPFLYWVTAMRERRLSPFGKRRIFPYFLRENLLVNIVSIIEIGRKLGRRIWVKVRSLMGST